MKKRLMKSTDKVVSGVLGGVAEYFELDPTIVRLAYAVMTIFSGFPGFMLYIALMLAMPKKHKYVDQA